MEQIRATANRGSNENNSRPINPVGSEGPIIFDSSRMRHVKNNGSKTQNKLSDEELIRLFIENKEEEAFNEVVKRYTDSIFYLALRITRNHSHAEDVLQDVFITLARKLNTFSGESKFSTWLHKVTVNASYMHLRAVKKYRSEVSLDDYVPYDEYGALNGVRMKDWSDMPDDVLLNREGVEIIEKAVSELQEIYRTVFHLRDIEGFSNKEVGDILGLSVTTVKSRLHRARLFLRDKLSDYLYEGKK